MKESGKQRPAIFLLSSIGILAVLTLLIIVSLSWSASFSTAAAAFALSSTNACKMDTAGAKRTPPSAGTSMPLQPAAPLPSQASMLTNIFMPVVENAGEPYPYKARLPLLVKTDDTSSGSAEIPYIEKTIVVDLSDQHVYAYEKRRLVFSFTASTGRRNLTRPGHYRILDKTPNAYSDPWGFWMPYWMGIYYVGYNLENGFHSLPVLSNGVKIWGDKIGTPVTYGCVVLMPNDMKKLYRWASVGTAVIIQK